MNLLFLFKQPAGIVLTGGLLCGKSAEPKATPQSLTDARRIVADLGLKQAMIHGVLIITDGTNAQEEEELHFKVSRFSPPPGPLSMEGSILDGIVTQEIDHPPAYIGSFLGGNEEHNIDVPLQVNKSVEDILNTLVLMDGKGTWILHRPVKTSDPEFPISHRGILEIQSYVDFYGAQACRDSDMVTSAGGG